jgi:hypothetical protein
LVLEEKSKKAKELTPKSVSGRIQHIM